MTMMTTGGTAAHMDGAVHTAMGDPTVGALHTVGVVHTAQAALMAGAVHMAAGGTRAMVISRTTRNPIHPRHRPYRNNSLALPGTGGCLPPISCLRIRLHI
jgi:hypothetical protein